MTDLKQIESILSFYNCPCEVLTSRALPMFNDYFLQPVNGTTLKKLQARVADFSLMIGATCQIIIDNGQLVLRTQTGSQKTYDFFAYSHNMENKQGNIALGLDARGGFVSCNLFTLPHLLIAGATGSGKSVFMHNAIVSLAMNGGACLRLIDLKRVELSRYNGCNFVIDKKCITDYKTADISLQNEVLEMQNRYKLMEKYGVRDYRQLPPKKALQARVIIIDELADLLLNKATRRNVENSIVKIAQLGRAAGCHLILATQRPSREVITGLIKANIPARLSFKTASSIDSRVIGIQGAENLRGRGDCLYIGGELSTPERLQAFYISDGHLQLFVDGVKRSQPKIKRRLF